jgi:Helicase associated domain
MQEAPPPLSTALQQKLIRDLRYLFTLQTVEQFESCNEKFQSEFEMERLRRRGDVSQRNPVPAAKARNNGSSNSNKKRVPPAATTFEAQVLDDHATASTHKNKKIKGNTVSRGITLPSRAVSRDVATTANTNKETSPPQSPTFPLEPTLDMLGAPNGHLPSPPPPPPPPQDTTPQATTITTATPTKGRISSHQQAWERNFNKLQAFKTVFSHVNIPHGEKCHAPLYAWVKKQRFFWRESLRGNPCGPLSQDDIARLEGVGLTPGEGVKGRPSAASTEETSRKFKSSSWHPTHQQAWLEKYFQLEQFKHTHGHVHVPSANAPEYAPLYSWIVMQRSQWRKERQGLKHRLHREQIEKLVAVGLGTFQDGPFVATEFVGSTNNVLAKQRMQAWMEKCSELRDFMATNGGRAPSHDEDTAHGHSLFAWLNNQKYRWRKALKPSRKEGDEDKGDDDQDVDGEVEKQREENEKRLKRGRPLCQEQMQLLIDMGLGDGNGPTAKRIVASWDESFQALQQFYREHGHCIISRNNEHSTKHLKLDFWIRNQKHSFKKGRLTEEQVSKLESLGIHLSQHQTKDDDAATTNK